MHFDDEELYFATSNVESLAADSCEVYAADKVEAKQLSSKGREQLAKFSQGGAFGIPEQLSVCPTDLALPAGDVFGVPQTRSGDTRSAHPACRANSALSDKELHAPLFDDETWLLEAPLERMLRESPFAASRLQPGGRMVTPPLCQRIACRRTCQAPTMHSEDFSWELIVGTHEVSSSF
eukprot:3704457-Amphidinium_carterae.1